MDAAKTRAQELLREFKGDDYVYGLDVLDRAGELTATVGKKALFIGHLDSPWFAPFQEKVLASLTAAGVEVIGQARGVAPNAPQADVYRLHSHMVHRRPEVVVAMGGGSTIDAAKGAAALASLGDLSPELDPFFGMGEVTKFMAANDRRPILPVVAVMTAASSAAHLTKYSNITDPAAGQKKLIVDEAITPPKCLFDYGVTAAQPVSLTLDGALDGIAHTVEVYFGAPENIAAKTREICVAALDLIIPGVLAASDNPADTEARMLLGMGTDLGGYAIMVGGTNGPHLNSFSLVDVLSHGRACALMLPYYTAFFAPAIEAKLRVVGQVYQRHGLLDGDLNALRGGDLGRAVAGAMMALSRRIGFPATLQEVEGVGPQHLERCLAAAKNPQLEMKLRNMPVSLNADLVDDYMGPILQAAWEGDLGKIRCME
jgi:alcohol dehydrogenase